MVASRRLALVALACLALSPAALRPKPANAAAGELDSPSVATPAGYPHVDKVMAALKRPDCKFIRGFWLNSFTTLSYGGSTQALGHLMEELSQIPGVVVSVSFCRAHPDDKDQSWSLSHSAFDNQFAIRINLDSKQIDLEKLYIPPIKK